MSNIGRVWTRSATELARDIREGRLKSLDLVDYYIRRIESYDASINAVVVKLFESARTRAREADRALARGVVWGPLHGVPITVKECFWIKDTRSTCAIADMPPFSKNFKATSDAPVIVSLRDAGCIFLGKTNLPSHAADIQSYNSVYGITSNPHDVTKTSGGSSGGSAAAICAGFSALELGSDIGGSIRTPAHFCGVVAHKPTQGIVPLEGHSPGFNHRSEESNIAHQSRIDAMSHRLAVAGPIARSCEDLDLAMRLIAMPDPAAARNGWQFSLPEARIPARKEPHRLRIAAWLDDDFCPVDSEVVRAMKNAVSKLRDVGASVDMNARPDRVTFKRSHEAYEIILGADMGSVKGLEYTKWFHAQLRRNFIKNRWKDFFERYDVLLCPVAPMTAFEHDHGPRSKRMLTINGESRNYWQAGTRWAGLIILADLPSTVVPVGVDSSGMPIGIQIVGAHWQDLQTIEVGRLFESLGMRYIPPKGLDGEVDNGVALNFRGARSML
eukprot:g3416.t1